MALVAFAIPKGVGRKLMPKPEVPGKLEDLEHYHVTLAYIDEASSPTDMAALLEAVAKLTERSAPIPAVVEEVSNFKKGDDGYPIVCHVKSEPLHQFQRELLKVLDGAGIEYSKKWPEYRPHITLSYAQEPYEAKIDEVALSLDSVVILSDFYENLPVEVYLPLRNDVAKRVAARYCNLEYTGSPSR
jgi:2'-5' RNA ligase